MPSLEYQQLKPIILKLLRLNSEESYVNPCWLEENLRSQTGSSDNIKEFKNKISWAIRELATEKLIIKKSPRSQDLKIAKTVKFLPGVVKNSSYLTGRLFENECKRILQQLNFENIKILGKTNDQGVDGEADFQICEDIILKFAFQCKGGGSKVTSPQVREFIGAISLGYSAGILFSLNGFTAEAHSVGNKYRFPKLYLLGTTTILQTNYSSVPMQHPRRLAAIR